jgi:hypothetical protein
MCRVTPACLVKACRRVGRGGDFLAWCLMRSYMTGLSFNPEDGGREFLPDIGKLRPVHTVSSHGTLFFEYNFSSVNFPTCLNKINYRRKCEKRKNWTGYVERMGTKETWIQSFIGMPEGNRLSGRYSGKCYDTSRFYLLSNVEKWNVCKVFDTKYLRKENSRKILA